MGVLRDWGGCSRCGEMFFDGFPDNKGQCPAGGVHDSGGFNFVLLHTTPPSGGPCQPGRQGCNKKLDATARSAQPQMWGYLS
jgi:hypothetical protein